MEISEKFGKKRKSKESQIKKKFLKKQKGIMIRNQRKKIRKLRRKDIWKDPGKQIRFQDGKAVARSPLITLPQLTCTMGHLQI